MPATIYAINKNLNYSFGSGSYIQPSTWYIGLSTTALTASDTSGSVPTEPSDAAYAKVAFANNKTNWSTATSGSLYNLTSASFTQSSTDQGTIVAVFLTDASAISAGNIWYYYTLSPAIAVQANQVVTFEPGKIVALQT